MILGFKQHFPCGKPTYFREKIWAGANRMDLGAIDQQGNPVPYLFIPGLAQERFFAKYSPKIHTIREDSHDRWKAGRSIQMVYRGPKYSIEHHFNKGIPELGKCVSVQTISIRWINIHTKPLPNFVGEDISKMDSFTSTRQVEILIDGNNINHERLQILARNDGFNSSEDFLRWFSEDFKGKIIHWANFKY